MAISNYTELQAAIADWLERSDLNARIKDFIALAEARIFRKLRTPANERTILIDRQLDDGDELLLPEHFLELKRLIVNGKPLTRITDSQYYNKLAKTGQPEYFFRYANRLKVYPSPADDYRWVLNFWSDFELSDTDPTNTVLTVAPDLYLFGALCEAEPFLENDGRVALWEEKFRRGLEDIQDMADDAELAGSASISGAAYP